MTRNEIIYVKLALKAVFFEVQILLPQYMANRLFTSNLVDRRF